MAENEQVVHRFARDLSAKQRVEQSVYDEGVGAFGEKSLVDMKSLIGVYLFTSAALDAFEIPAPTSGLKGAAGAFA